MFVGWEDKRLLDSELIKRVESLVGLCRLALIMTKAEKLFICDAINFNLIPQANAAASRKFALETKQTNRSGTEAHFGRTLVPGAESLHWIVK